MSAVMALSTHEPGGREVGSIDDAPAPPLHDVQSRLSTVITDLPPEWPPSGQARRTAPVPRDRRGARDTRSPNHRVSRLSEREHQVARRVAQGLKDLVIARRLGISVSTVGTYVRHIRHRLKLDSRAEIAAWVTARLNPDDPTGRLRRHDPTHTPEDPPRPRGRSERQNPCPSPAGEGHGPCR